MQIDEIKFKAMPSALQALFAKLPNHGSDEVLAAFQQAAGQLAPVASSSAPSEKTSGIYGRMRREGEASADSANSANGGAIGFKMKPGMRRLDTGSAARFFYCAKASGKERNEGCEALESKIAGCMKMRNDAHAHANGLTGSPKQNTHPTVKPVALCGYLCRLVTPPGGTVLDLYMGSGSIGVGAIGEGFNYIGIDKDEDEKGTPLGYMDIAQARIAHAAMKRQ